MTGTEFNRRHFSKFPGKTHYLGLGRSKLKADHPVNYFPGFLGKNIENCKPTKLFFFTSLSEPVHLYSILSSNTMTCQSLFQNTLALINSEIYYCFSCKMHVMHTVYEINNLGHKKETSLFPIACAQFFFFTRPHLSVGYFYWSLV